MGMEWNNTHYLAAKAAQNVFSSHTISSSIVHAFAYRCVLRTRRVPLATIHALRTGETNNNSVRTLRTAVGEPVRQ